MAKPKAAMVKVAAYFVDCPNCDEGIENPEDGSQLWDANFDYPATVVCRMCGETLRLSIGRKGK